eukprot:CAMPEP_0184743078 /NCGR_PEP_ID=MMETSP0315-20130426/5946_1 /TAXON_ID=101924 /ORGANISM="Rhodosorus marinus, Strain UTEX LB 2760" /LENGTH=361 /DNA_ID=CAMNT_0027214165 /DNA_START=280 /DNA_END=1365 /DNA_ORIENTATION=+
MSVTGSEDVSSSKTGSSGELVVPDDSCAMSRRDFVEEKDIISDFHRSKIPTGIAVAYRERKPSSSSNPVNWKLMHTAVPATLFDVRVKRSVEPVEVSEAFGVKKSTVEKNWNLPKNETRRPRQRSPKSEMQWRNTMFSKPVNLNEVTASLLLLRSSEPGRFGSEFREEVQESLHIDGDYDLQNGGSFVAEVSVQKLHKGEVCLELGIGVGRKLQFYSNGEVFLDEEYHGTAVGFGSKNVLKIVLEQSCSMPVEYCSRVTSGSEKSIDETGCDGRKDTLLLSNLQLNVLKDNNNYYTMFIKSSTAKLVHVEMCVFYPSAGSVGLSTAVEEVPEDESCALPTLCAVQSSDVMGSSIISPVIAI